MSGNEESAKNDMEAQKLPLSEQVFKAAPDTTVGTIGTTPATKNFFPATTVFRFTATNRALWPTPCHTAPLIPKLSQLRLGPKCDALRLQKLSPVGTSLQAGSDTTVGTTKPLPYPCPAAPATAMGQRPSATGAKPLLYRNSLAKLTQIRPSEHSEHSPR